MFLSSVSVSVNLDFFLSVCSKPVPIRLSLVSVSLSVSRSLHPSFFLSFFPSFFPCFLFFLFFPFFIFFFLFLFSLFIFFFLSFLLSFSVYFLYFVCLSVCLTCSRTNYLFLSTPGISLSCRIFNPPSPHFVAAPSSELPPTSESPQDTATTTATTAATATGADAETAPPKRRKLETPAAAAGRTASFNPGTSRGNWGGSRYGGGGGGGGGGSAGTGRSIQSRNENFVRLNMKLKKYRKKGS